MLGAAIIATILFTLLLTPNCILESSVASSDYSEHSPTPKPGKTGDCVLNGTKLANRAKRGTEFPCGIWWCDHEHLHFNKCRPGRPDCILAAPGKGAYPRCCQGLLWCGSLRPRTLLSVWVFRPYFWFF
ncbi:uncharacterized protein LOC144148018 [Haemaphysalis longicornis]